MTRPRRAPFWRWGTVLPAIVTAVAGTAVAVVVAQSSGLQPASFADHAPLGHLDGFHEAAGGIRAEGWSFDPDHRTAPITVYSRVDGKTATTATASATEPGLAKSHPHAGGKHRFTFVTIVPRGKHTVCIYGRNVGKGKDYRIGCTTKDFEYGPRGAISSVTASHGAVHVSGWAFDPDNKHATLTTTITVDGLAHSVVANRSRADVAKAHPFAGPLHGYSASYSVAQGAHTVCIKVKNVAYGSDTNFGCRKVTLNDSPRGHFDSLGQTSGKLRVVGWAFDPDAPTQALTMAITIDGVAHSTTAQAARSDVAKSYPSAGKNHGLDARYSVAEGKHTVCVTARNVSFGRDVSLGCKTYTVSFVPTASATAATATATGARLTGWASDPDTSAPVSVRVTLDGRLVTTVTANGKGSTHSGHNFTANVATVSGKHTLCATALNLLYGTRNSTASCRAITLALNPIGKFETLTRAVATGPVRVTGWALDPDTASPISVAVTLDGKAVTPITASTARTDVAKSYPTLGANHGFSTVLSTTDGEHTVCLTARNSGAGADVSLGCKLIIAVHPTAPSAPQSVVAQAGYGGATLTWAAPASDGGAPWTSFVVTASPSGTKVTVGATARTATVTGLKPSTTYSFSVTAVNVAGTSAPGTSAAVKTQASPPPQKTPAPVSTSRYIRNIRGASSSELATMRAEGIADAKANPSGHGYLILLDIGGQDQYDGGVVLSATTRFVTYANLVKDVEAYVDGYHAGQRASAPLTLAIGTNNDMDVTAAAGKAWADKVVDPIAAYAKRYTGITVAGANDIEPGFRASYSQTRSWLTGYLGATSAPFVFNGSADGCSWTATNRGCNNGWSMAGLYYLAAGAAPIRMLNLPQIYNTTMASQWKYISLTGVASKQPRINFAGTLTEWTACDQTNSCGSLTGHNAWSSMWSNLQSDSRLKVGSLPYSTDLRIDK